MAAVVNCGRETGRAPLYARLAQWRVGDAGRFGCADPLPAPARPFPPIGLSCARSFSRRQRGDLAMNGAVNDIAIKMAPAALLSAGFIVEEGLPCERLGLIAESMGEATARAGVTIVTGDTKVVDKGHGDGVFINTSGFGVMPGRHSHCTPPTAPR